MNERPLCCAPRPRRRAQITKISLSALVVGWDAARWCICTYCTGFHYTVFGSARPSRLCVRERRPLYFRQGDRTHTGTELTHALEPRGAAHTQAHRPLHPPRPRLHPPRPRLQGPKGLVSTLALTATRPRSHYNVCLHRGEQLIGLFLLVNCFDLCRLEGSHVTAAAALLALPALPAVLAEVFAAAILAIL